MLTRFLRDIKGVAAIEFAFVVPVFLIMLFSGFEVGRYVMLMNKLQSTGFSLANIIAQTEPASRTNACLPSRLTQPKLDNILTGAVSLMRPFSTENASYKVVVTSLEKTNGGMGMRWQVSQGDLADATSEISGTPPGPCTARPCPATPVTFIQGTMSENYVKLETSNFAALQTGENVLALEVFYRYTPTFPAIFGQVSDTFTERTLVKRVYFYNRLGKAEFLPPTYMPVDQIPCATGPVT